jgi:hypothetical protein
MQTSGLNERQTDKPAGRQTIRQDSNKQDRKETVKEIWEQTTDWQKDRQTYRRMYS